MFLPMARRCYMTTRTQLPSANFIGQTGNDFRGNDELRTYSSVASSLVESRESPPGRHTAGPFDFAQGRHTRRPSLHRITIARSRASGATEVECEATAEAKRPGQSGCPGPS